MDDCPAVATWPCVWNEVGSTVPTAEAPGGATVDLIAGACERAAVGCVPGDASGLTAEATPSGCRPVEAWPGEANGFTEASPIPADCVPGEATLDKVARTGDAEATLAVATGLD